MKKELGDAKAAAVAAAEGAAQAEKTASAAAAKDAKAALELGAKKTAELSAKTAELEKVASGLAGVADVAAPVVGELLALGACGLCRPPALCPAGCCNCVAQAKGALRL